MSEEEPQAKKVKVTENEQGDVALSITSKISLNDGSTMPVFGLGTWRSGANETKEAVKTAIRCGYIHIDTAFAYGIQKEVGEGIAESITAGDITRENLYVTSKLWLTHLKPENVRANLDQTLEDLGLSYLDQFLIHWPYALQKLDPYEMFPVDSATGKFMLEDPPVDMTQTWAEMEKLVDAGLVKTIGVSNFTMEQLEPILKSCRIRPAINQVEAHPFFNQAELSAALKAENIALSAYSPLGNLAPAKEDIETPLRAPAVVSLGQKYSKSPAQVILRWHLQKGNMTFPKSVTSSRIEENAQIFDFELTADDMAQIDALGEKNLRMCNPPFGLGGERAFPGDTWVDF